ncbi:FAD-dependent oxidoreductase, partial [bacterium]|nr:FAD-dependent oxidoreductase [bacterium]
MPDYDLLVIGAGSGGVRAARMAAATGAKVAVIEKRYLGGTCVNVGCVPKKLFYYGAHFSETFSEAGHYGWDVKVDDFDWPRLRENKNQEIARLNGIYQRLLEQAGVEIIRGHASLISDTRLEVNGQHISADKILIAVGGAPYVPEFPGSDFVVTSDDVFFLEHLPKRALVVGGGYIAVEFAGIWKGMGVDVDLAYRGQQLLRHFDEDLGKQLAISMYEQGIGLRLGDNVRRIEREAESLKVEFISGEIQRYDVVLYATGR